MYKIYLSFIIKCFAYMYLCVSGMIEHGLIESANYGIHKHISQNMKTTSLGSLGSESDDFMEIR